MSEELCYTMLIDDGEFAVNVTDELASDLSVEEIRNVGLDRISRARILFRQFTPFSTPAAYRHAAEKGWDEWRSEATCQSCKYHGRKRPEKIPGPMGCQFYYSWSPHKEWCRWTEYIHILFRQFTPPSKEE
jgi:hypothetical protein